MKDAPTAPVSAPVPYVTPEQDPAQLAAVERAIADVVNRFTYRAPRPGQPAVYEALRGQARSLALSFVSLVPAGREQALALTHLEQAIFWANAGVARSGGVPR
jgi:hypothetical protein